MDNVQRRKARKNTKSNKKPIKIVHISNPMKVNTSASQFRALVQELTGQDAGSPDPTKFTNINNDATANPTALLAAGNPITGTSTHEQQERSDFSFEDAFMPQMFDKFSF
ncbi:hypothetical protein Patl1_20913 [Pistacia atlantica]|uniref:Uncharacterized protein n=1 Tax=Pistacia atlantica TaxID=434234 RepID=A0ACC1BHU1_9ROSI|nr:hypothetical protein Patl1_20913 [Pistacia atlantica]